MYIISLKGGTIKIDTKHTIFNSDKIIVESGATIDGSFAGYPGQQGPGRGTTTQMGGSFASHGGHASEHSVYGHYNSQFQPGSGGGQGSGGALMEFNAGVEAIVDGSIRTTGQGVSYSYGAGSGGCIVVRTFDLRGKGVLTVDGGTNCVFF